MTTGTSHLTNMLATCHLMTPSRFLRVVVSSHLLLSAQGNYVFWISLPSLNSRLGSAKRVEFLSDQLVKWERRVGTFEKTTEMVAQELEAISSRQHRFQRKQRYVFFKSSQDGGRASEQKERESWKTRTRREVCRKGKNKNSLPVRVSCFVFEKMKENRPTELGGNPELVSS